MRLDISELVDTPLEQISIDSIEDFYSQLIEVIDDDLSGRDNDILVRLFLFTQHVLKFKDDQLSLVIEELDSRAAVNAEVEELRAENIRLLELSGSSHIHDHEKLNVLELKRTVDKLRKDLKNKELQLSNETSHGEKLKQQLSELEVDRHELHQQVQQLRETIEDIQQSNEPKSDVEDTTAINYADILKQKNQNINMLFEEVETAERENMTLKEANTTLQHKLDEATAQMSAMAEEFDILKNRAEINNKHDNESAILVAELRTRLSQVQRAKARRDIQFDQMASCVEQRSDQLQLIVQQKDQLIDSLKQQLKAESDRLSVSAISPSRDVISVNPHQSSAAVCQQCQRLSAEVNNQRRQLSQLRNQLARATADMESTTQLINKKQQQQKSGARETLLPLRSQLTRAECQILQLKDTQDRLEIQAAEKDNQIATLTVELRRVVSGQYGLPEARAEVKQCRRDLALRDQQLAKQNGYVNTVHAHLTAVLEENTVLRTRLGMSAHQACSLVGLQTGQQHLIKQLEREVQQLEEERIALKLENRKLCAEVKRGGHVGLTAEEIKLVCQQRQQFWHDIKQQTKEKAEGQSAVSSTLHLLQRVSSLEEELATTKHQLKSVSSTHTQQQQAAQTQPGDCGTRTGSSSPTVRTAKPGQCATTNETTTNVLPIQTTSNRSPSVNGDLTGEHMVESGVSLDLPEGIDDKHLAQLLNSQLVHVLQSCRENEISWRQADADFTRLTQLCRDRGAQLSAVYRQHSHSLDQLRQKQEQLEQLRTENQVLSAQLHQAELCQQALAAKNSAATTNSDGDLQAAVSSLHQQMALRVSQVIRLQRRLRVSSDHSLLLADRASAARHEVTRVNDLYQHQLARAAAEIAFLRRQLYQATAVASDTCSQNEVGNLSSDVCQLMVCSGGESNGSILTAEQVEKWCHSLTVENRVSQRLDQELLSLRQQLFRGGRCSVETDGCGRVQYLECQMQLLRQQLEASEQRCSNLERLVARDRRDKYSDTAATTSQHTLDSLDRCVNQLYNTLRQWHHTLSSVDGLADADADAECSRQHDTAWGHELIARDNQLGKQLSDASVSGDSELERELRTMLDSADDSRSSLATLQLQLVERQNLVNDLQTRCQQLQSTLTARDQQLLTQQKQTAAKHRLLQLLHVQGVAVWKRVAEQLNSITQLVKQRLFIDNGCEESRECATGESEGVEAPASVGSQLLLHRLAEVLQQRSDLLELSRQISNTSSNNQEYAGNNINNDDGTELVHETGDGSVSGRWLTRYQQARADTVSARAQARHWRSAADSLRQRLIAEERRCADRELIVCQLYTQLEMCRVSNVCSLRITLNDEADALVSAADPADCQPDADTVSRSPHVNVSPRTTTINTYHKVENVTNSAVTSSSDNSRTDVAVVVDRVYGKVLADQLYEQGRILMNSLEQCQPLVKLGTTQTDPAIQRLKQLMSEMSSSQEEHAVTTLPKCFTHLLDFVETSTRVCCYLLCQMSVSVTTHSLADESPGQGSGHGHLVEQLSAYRAVISALQDRLSQKEELVTSLTATQSHNADPASQQVKQLTDSLIQERAKSRQMCVTIESLERELCSLRGCDRQLTSSLTASATCESSEESSGCGNDRLQLLGRVRECEQLLAEQERAIGVLMDRLRQSRNSESHLKQVLERLESRLCSSPTSPSNKNTPAVVTIRLPAERDECATNVDNQPSARRDRLQTVFSRLLSRYPRHIRLIQIIQKELMSDESTDDKCGDIDSLEQLSAASDTPKSVTASDARTACQQCCQLRKQLEETGKSLEQTKHELNGQIIRCHRLQTELYEANRRRRNQTQSARQAANQLQQQLTALQTSCNKQQLHKPQRDSQQVASETAQWREKKDWQLCVQRLRSRLQQSQLRCDQLSMSRDSLTQLVHRLKRDARLLELKLLKQQQQQQQQQAAPSNGGTGASDSTTTKHQANSTTILSPSGEVHHAGTSESDGEPCSEQCAGQRQKLHTRIQMLAQKLANERTNFRQLKMRKVNSAGVAELADLRTEIDQLKSANIQLKKDLDQSESERTNLLSRFKQSQLEQPVIRDTDAGGDNPQNTSATYTSRPVDSAAIYSVGTVSVLRRLVERLRDENCRLRQRLVYSGFTTE